MTTNVKAMKPSVYLETSVISYLTARPSNDVRVVANQNITTDWWENRRSDFNLYISEFVIAEASRGHSEAAARRMAAIKGIAELKISEEARDLAKALIAAGSIPEKAQIDAFHVAVAAVNGINFLLTWNCAHIANAVMRSKIEAVCREEGVEPSIICTPNELLEA